LEGTFSCETTGSGKSFSKWFVVPATEKFFGIEDPLNGLLAWRIV
jgi:hypothetical protein